MSPHRRRQIGPVLGLMFAGAIAEVVSLGAILPFLSVVTSPHEAVASSRLRPLLDFFSLDTPLRIIVAATIGFAISAVVAAVVRLRLVWVSQKFIYGVAEELSISIYHKTLCQPYSHHTESNSSDTFAAINKAQLITTQLLVPQMQALIAIVISLFILGGLIFIDTTVAIGSGLGFAAIYLAVMRFTRKKMRLNGAIIAQAQAERVQAASEGLGGIRDILLDRSQPVFVTRFAAIEGALRNAQASNNFVGQAPRFIVEGLGLVLIAALALMLSLREGGLVGAVPVLGVLALGAQRLLPLLQQIFTGWATMMNNGRMLQDILDILRLPDSKHVSEFEGGALHFERAIALENVSFSYPAGGVMAIKDVSLTLPKGARVGFIGKTGSGKSTLMDLILGLLTPTNGRIMIDDTALTDMNRAAWQARIAHVPQAIYLSDATISENIAFGVPLSQINIERVREAAKKADLSEVIDTLPQGYNTFVGERGIRLSGGQRQRIGIARALYKQADVLIFDEATSALDNDTENSVMNAIEELDRSFTMLIIAHRTSTVENCDFSVRLNSGQLELHTKPNE
ncbi:MAG: ABC transporter ATP-binding protein [Mesorhizobium sp.]|nr:ABC transporter ATP-binding protein [Mesorhizobium sp.]